MTDATLEQDHDMQDTPPPSKSGKRKRLFLIFGGAIVLIALCWWIWATFIAGDTESTENAYTNVEVSQVTPLVGGPVKRVAVVNT
jgi:membrane fusion protein (multidrug efflux system)